MSEPREDPSAWVFPHELVLPDEPPAWMRVLGDEIVREYADLPRTKAAFDAAEKEMTEENLEWEYEHEPSRIRALYSDRLIWRILTALWRVRTKPNPVAAAIEELTSTVKGEPGEVTAGRHDCGRLLHEHAAEIQRLLGRSGKNFWKPLPQGGSPDSGLSGPDAEPLELDALIADIRQALADGPLAKAALVARVRKGHGKAVSEQFVLSALRAASLRGVVETTRGEVSLACRGIEDYAADDLVKFLLAAMRAGGGQAEWHQDDLATAVARFLGFRRTGSKIRDAVRAAVRIAIRRGLLEREGAYLRRV